MARVTFSSTQQQFTADAECEVDASNYRELIDAITSRYPALDRAELLQMAVAIDGEIIHEPLLELVEQDSEIHFFHFIAGG